MSAPRGQNVHPVENLRLAHVDPDACVFPQRSFEVGKGICYAGWVGDDIDVIMKRHQLCRMHSCLRSDEGPVLPQCKQCWHEGSLFSPLTLQNLVVRAVLVLPEETGRATVELTRGRKLCRILGCLGGTATCLGQTAPGQPV